ncbi:hypothetical protein JOF48_001086 [Arthrobacter stackebrandtii]|uniref:Plasmid pRiA4b Orf3-like domain-containing protein n=1 Tax=Arthrobacter stackebrandtii TaxID=272161 RepID=A0ABS4YV47_9MICC|nr:plasmid pRiA4b ORF-3 family protein [Arthrobacter stackebrandtii]MBP2412287.1 hypothetical protein [Arthrobacter stackebrandtii]PYH02068.1 hypothetical protein CVV67_01090 [Arthrobacter stackebrandtii]
MPKKPKRPSEQRTVTSVGGLRASRAVDAVVPAFIQWCKDTRDISAQDAMDFLKPVELLVMAYFEVAPSSVATEFAAEPFGEALASLFATMDEASGGDDEPLMFAHEAIHLFLEFLDEAGIWTGTQEDYEQIHDLFHMDAEEVEELGGMDLPEPPSAEQELAALSETQLAKHLTSLLQWLGDGKQVTSTGALKLTEIEGAAAAVGLAAKGAGRNAKRQLIPGFNAEGLEPGTPLIVKTMHELPLLSKIWAALEGGGFIDVGSTKAWPTPNVEAMLSPGHPAHLAALRGLMANFLSVAVKGEQDWAPWVAPAAEAQAGLLYAAALAGHTIPLSLLENPETLESMGMDEFGGRLLRQRMAELEELGLVTMDGAVRVRPALVPMVLLAMGGHVEGGGVAGPRLPGSVSGGPGPAPTHPVPLLQLKVAIEDTKPPVWRRLVLRSDLTLAQLHSIIQASFEWLDYHLHEFNVGGRNGTNYGPLTSYDYDDGFGDPPQDEAAVTVGQLLNAEKDHISYTYDFGDNWRHRITLEKVLPFAKGPAVRCTGGRGMGPAEDCGGAWGWQNVVAAVNDPAHEEHTEYRGWLGMEQGETLDPKEFDREALDEELAELF